MAERGQRVVFDKEGKKQTETFADKAELQKEIKKEDWNDYLVDRQRDELQALHQRQVDERDDRQRSEEAGDVRHSGAAASRRPADEGGVQEHPDEAHEAGGDGRDEGAQEDRDGGRAPQPRPRRSRVQRRLAVAEEMSGRERAVRRDAGLSQRLAERSDGVRQRRHDHAVHGRRRRTPGDSEPRAAGRDRSS